MSSTCDHPDDQAELYAFECTGCRALVLSDPRIGEIRRRLSDLGLSPRQMRGHSAELFIVDDPIPLWDQVASTDIAEIRNAMKSLIALKAPSLLDPTGNEAAEREAVAQTERPGSWYGDTESDGRMLTQDETDILIRFELWMVNGMRMTNEQVAELRGVVGEPTVVRLLQLPGANPALQQLVTATRQRGGISSDPLVRLVAYRAWGDRDRRWFEDRGVREGESLAFVNGSGGTTLVGYPWPGEANTWTPMRVRYAAHDAWPGQSVSCEVDGPVYGGGTSVWFRVSDRLRTPPVDPSRGVRKGDQLAVVPRAQPGTDRGDEVALAWPGEYVEGIALEDAQPGQMVHTDERDRTDGQILRAGWRVSNRPRVQPADYIHPTQRQTAADRVCRYYGFSRMHIRRDYPMRAITIDVSANEPGPNRVAYRAAISERALADGVLGPADTFHRAFMQARQQMDNALGDQRGYLSIDREMIDALIWDIQTSPDWELAGRWPQNEYRHAVRDMVDGFARYPGGNDDMVDALMRAHSNGIRRSVTSLGTRRAELERRRSTEDYRARAESIDSREMRRLALAQEAVAINRPAVKRRKQPPPVPKWGKPKRSRSPRPGR